MWEESVSMCKRLCVSAHNVGVSRAWYSIDTSSDATRLVND